jgi:hypothetical protein
MSQKTHIRKGGAAGELLWATGGGDLGIWGVRKAYRPAHSVHANLMNRRIDSRQPSGLFGPLVPGGFAAPEVHVVNICQLGESAPLAAHCTVTFGRFGSGGPRPQVIRSSNAARRFSLLRRSSRRRRAAICSSRPARCPLLAQSVVGQLSGFGELRL